jgi:hypothetical protein
VSGDITLANKNVGAKKVWTWKESYGDYLTREESLKVAPKWYHLPENWERIRVYNVLTRLWIIKENDGNEFSKLLNLPLAGYRDSTNGSLYFQGASAHYWSSVPTGVNVYYLYFYSYNLFPQTTYYRFFRFSVRCFKDFC